MLNRLLEKVELFTTQSTWIITITEKIIDKVVPQATAMAGYYCGCDPDCARKEWRSWGGVAVCITVGQPGSCQPC